MVSMLKSLWKVAAPSTDSWYLRLFFAKLALQRASSWQSCFEAPRFIAIEGPIRVGKSTLAGILAETLQARRIVEPENNPFLDRFYQELSGMALATQMWFLVERYDQMRQAAKDLAGSEPLANRGRLPI